MRLRVAQGPGEWRESGPTVLAIGNFDGVHLGHQEILRRVVERARRDATLAAAVTFEPHPMKVLRPAEAPALISTLAQRIEELDRLGVERLLILPFDLQLAKLSPEEFVRTVLVETLQAATILLGENFRFGHRQAGDVKALTELGRRFGYTVEVVAPVVVRGEVVSSTGVRRAVGEGWMSATARLLGRPFTLTGSIKGGTGRGSRVVFPTLNLAADQELLPTTGVYVTECMVLGRWHRSATNVGVRPTFNGSTLSIESHLFDFSERLTSGPMQVRFWKRLRPERKFSGPEALREQIQQDLARCRRYFRHLDRVRKAGVGKKKERN